MAEQSLAVVIALVQQVQSSVDRLSDRIDALPGEYVTRHEWDMSNRPADAGISGLTTRQIVTLAVAAVALLLSEALAITTV